MIDNGVVQHAGVHYTNTQGYTIFTTEGHRHYRALNRPWYPSESCASFADMLNALRCESVRQQVLSLALQGPGSKKTLKTLFLAVQQVA